MIELQKNILGQVLGLLVASGELVGHVEDPFGVRVNEHSPGSFLAFQALFDDFVQVHSLHPDRRDSAAKSSRIFMISGYFIMILIWRYNEVSFQLDVVDTDPRPGVSFFLQGRPET
jgi:hypothetical protein